MEVMASSLQKPDLMSFEGNVPENLQIFFLSLTVMLKQNFQLLMKHSNPDYA